MAEHKSHSVTHAMVEMAKEHHPGDDFMAVHGHEDGYTTHHVVNGKMGGPHEHKSMRELKRHMAETMDCEEE